MAVLEIDCGVKESAQRAEKTLDEKNVLVEYRDGCAHVVVKSFPENINVQDWIMPLINRLEQRNPVRVHGLSPCLIPDAFELVVPDEEGVRHSTCGACTLKNLCKGFPKEFLQNNPEPSKPFEPVLREVGIEVNRACLFKCPFCFYQNFYEKEDKGFVPKDKILSLLDQMSANGVSLVRFFGGDPVLRSDFPEIIEYAKARGLYCIVNTNGLFRSEESKKRIVAAADSLIISVHGCDEHSEAVLTGRGDLLGQVLASVYTLLKEHPDKVVVSTLMTTFLVINKERYSNLFMQLGVRSWFISRPLFTVQEIQKYPWLDVQVQEIRDFSSFAARLMHQTGMRVVVNNLPLCMLDKSDRCVVQHNAQVNSMTRLFYDVNGFFKTGPSDGHIGVFMNGQDVKVQGDQNVANSQKVVSPQLVDEIVYNLLDGRRNLGSDMMRAWEHNPFRVVGDGACVPKECLSCREYLQCLGGSRTQAMAFSGRMDSPDPLMVGPIQKKWMRNG